MQNELDKNLNKQQQMFPSTAKGWMPILFMLAITLFMFLFRGGIIAMLKVAEI